LILIDDDQTYEEGTEEYESDELPVITLKSRGVSVDMNEDYAPAVGDAVTPAPHPDEPFMVRHKWWGRDRDRAAGDRAGLSPAFPRHIKGPGRNHFDRPFGPRQQYQRRRRQRYERRRFQSRGQLGLARSERG
jgi:hypothetical protein